MKNILMTLGIALCVVSQPLLAAKDSSKQTEASQNKGRKGKVKKTKAVKKTTKRRGCCFHKSSGNPRSA